MYTFETEIEQAQVMVSFDFQPEEPVVMYYSDGSGDPGCSASVDNISVYWKTRKFNSTKLEHEDVEIDITDLIAELGYDMEDECFEHINSQNPD